jgi:hypothetical protein
MAKVDPDWSLSSGRPAAGPGDRYDDEADEANFGPDQSRNDILARLWSAALVSVEPAMHAASGFD